MVENIFEKVHVMLHTNQKSGGSNPFPGLSEISLIHDMLVRTCPEANKHDVAMIMISACLRVGIDVRNRIISELSRLGLNPAHIAIMLDKNTGSSADLYHWKLVDGRYVANDPTAF